MLTSFRFVFVLVLLMLLTACSSPQWIHKNVKETGLHKAGSLVFAVNYATLSSQNNTITSKISVSFDTAQLFRMDQNGGFDLFMYVKTRTDSLIFQKAHTFIVSRDSLYNFTWEIALPKNTEGTIQVKISDRFSQDFGITERRFSTFQIHDFFTSDPALGICLPNSPETSFQPRPSQSFSNADTVLCVFIREHNLPENSELQVTLSSDLLKFKRSARTAIQPHQPIYLQLPIDDLRVSTYSVTGVYRQENAIIGQWSKQIDLPWRTAYLRAGKKDLLRLLRYITTPKEFKILKKSKEEEFFQNLEKFWELNDPVPSTPKNEFRDEFFRRVELANTRYSTINYNNGWQTDRGRILIKYGEPDDIERHPFDFGQPAYEIWYYYNQNVTFYFIDEKGINQYELYNTWTEGK